MYEANACHAASAFTGTTALGRSQTPYRSTLLVQDIMAWMCPECHLLRALNPAGSHFNSWCAWRRSPHVTTLRERLAVDGQPIAPAAFAALVQGAAEDVAAAQREDARLSHFEALTALALRHFQQQQARLKWHHMVPTSTVACVCPMYLPPYHPDTYVWRLGCCNELSC